MGIFPIDTKAEQHAKGQSDAAKGTYDPPNGLADVSGFNGLGETCNFEEKNAAYEAGHANASNQKKS